MAAGRFKLNQIAGKDFSPEENVSLANKAANYLKEQWEGTRDIYINDKGRITIGTSTIPIKENKGQQLLSILMAADAETKALRGIDVKPELKLSEYDKRGIGYVQEAIGRGLVDPTSFFKIAGLGFRNKAAVSTDNLVEKFINSTISYGRGFDSETGGATNKQYSEEGHKEDHNLNPSKGEDIDNIAPQSKTVNKITADSAKGNSLINPKYKSIIDLRKAGLKLIREEPITRYNDDGDSDLYGSALDQLLEGIRNIDNIL